MPRPLTRLLPLLLLLAFAAPFARAAGSLLETHTLQRWTIEDGLPESSINAIEPAADGYLFVATLHRLLRFDGVNFVPVDEGAPWRPTSAILQGVRQDRRGRLWVYSTTGAWWRENGRWNTARIAASPTKPFRVIGMHEMPDGQVVFFTPAGIAHGPPDALVLSQPEVDGQKLPLVSAGCAPDGAVLVSTTQGLFRYRDSAFQPFEAPANTNPAQIILNRSGQSSAILAGQAVWLATEASWKKVAASTPSIGLPFARGDSVWVGTEQRLIRFGPDGVSALSAAEARAPIDARGFAATEDGALWLGTSGGLVRLQKRAVRTHTGPSPRASTVFTSLWIGPDGEAVASIAGLGLALGRPDALALPARPGSADGIVASALWRDPDSALWIGTFGEYLWRTDSEGTKRVRQAEGGVSARGVNAVQRDRAGHLWVGTWDGLMRLEGDRLTPFVVTGRRDLGPTHLLDAVHDLTEDEEGNLWVAYATAGVLRIRSNGTQRLFTQADGLPAPGARALASASDGELWVATAAGLARIAADAVTVFKLTRSDLRQILADADGQVWVGTGDGLLRVDTAKLRDDEAGAVRRFGIEDGLPTARFPTGTGSLSQRAPDGTLWFCTEAGLVCVDPRSLPALPPPPPVHIDSFSYRHPGSTPDSPVFLYRRDWQNASLPVALTLPPDSRELLVKFAAPTFASGPSTQFSIRLLGFDPTWQDLPPGEREARFARLPAGSYTLEARAADSAGGWSEPASLLFTISPPYWETTWFAVLAGLSLCGTTIAGATFIVRRREKAKTRRRVAELERRHAVEMERSRIARDLHDDLGAGLTEISLLSELALKHADDLDGTRRSLREITGSARAIIDTLDEIVWAVNPQNDTLPSLATYLAYYARTFLAKARVTCRLDVASSLPALEFAATARHQVFLACKEALTNLARHSEATECLFTIQVEAATLRIAIRDNGRGLPAQPIGADGGDHAGLANYRHRLESLGGEVRLDSVPGQGLTVTFLIPLKTALLSPK